VTYLIDLPPQVCANECPVAKAEQLELLIGVHRKARFLFYPAPHTVLHTNLRTIRE
jgi:hypothetical protein